MARIEDILPCYPRKKRRGPLREKLLENELEHPSEIREMVRKTTQLVLLSLLPRATNCIHLS